MQHLVILFEVVLVIKDSHPTWQPFSMIARNSRGPHRVQHHLVPSLRILHFISTLLKRFISPAWTGAKWVKRLGCSVSWALCRLVWLHTVLPRDQTVPRFPFPPKHATSRDSGCRLHHPETVTGDFLVYSGGFVVLGTPK